MKASRDHAIAPAWRRRALGWSMAWVASVAASTPGWAADSVAQWFSEGKFGVDLRYRLENVDEDNFEPEATASTLRARLNFRSGSWNGFGFFAEYDHVLTVGPDDYNAGAGNTPDRVHYPVIADPDGPDLNQAHVQWEFKGGTLLRAGRQRIIYDNARFVGNVGWRQNEQTYDGVHFQHRAAGFDWQAAWVGQVNRIFGRDVPDGQHDNDTWLLNVSKAFAGVGKLTGYYYDIDDRDAASFSTTSYGVRFAGDLERKSAVVGFAAEVARQVEAYSNPVDYSAGYYRLDLSVTVNGLTPYVGFESLGGDDSRAGAAFRTPLATLHAFNGWADKFLVTPGAGLDDLFLGVRGKIGGWAWDVLYHDFTAESGGGDFGSEVDASLGRPLFDNCKLLFKAARFDGEASSPYRDTTKVWVQLEASF